jgi:hypothetical protein
MTRMRLSSSAKADDPVSTVLACGTPLPHVNAGDDWMPAFAGMTSENEAAKA